MDIRCSPDSKGFEIRETNGTRKIPDRPLEWKVQLEEKVSVAAEHSLN